jgi:AcrR family transcriptional regulator
MARTSRDLDKKLLLVGEALIQEVGVSGLSMREVAKIAEVNLGMLSYYFKGKDEFVLKILSSLYSPFIHELESMKSLEHINEEERFKSLLNKMSQFSFTHRRLIMVLMKDLLSGDPTFKNFMETHFSKHFTLISDEIFTYLKWKKINPTHWPRLQRTILSSIGLSNVMLAYQEMHFNQRSNESEQFDLQIQGVLALIEKHK